jgi:ribonuclease HII
MIIVGVDEVGRGCLVGNVVAGAVILPDDFYYILRDFMPFNGINRT